MSNFIFLDDFKKFIEDNIALIEAYRFEELYSYRKFIPQTTELLHDIGIPVEKYLTELPTGFMAYNSDSEYVVPKHITKIGQSAFQSCENLTKIVVEGLITEIPEACFLESNNLKEIYLPGTIKRIGINAFPKSPLNKSTDIYFDGTKADWKSIDIDAKNFNARFFYTVHCIDGDIIKRRR